MNPFFVLPLVPTIDASSTAAVATNPITNLLLDEPGLTYRANSATAAAIVLDLGAATSIDTVALLGSNLRNTDNWQVRAATSIANLTASPTYNSNSIAAWSGTKIAAKSKLVHQLTSSHSARYWRIDMTATAHPDGYLEASRLVINARTEWPLPLPTGAHQMIIDPSIIEEVEGYETIDERDELPGWQLPFDFIRETEWDATVWPFLRRAKLSRRLLFVPFPDTATKLQDTAVFGRIRSFENEHPYHDGWMVNMAIFSNGL